MSYTLVVPVNDIDSVEVSVQRHVGAPLAAPALGKASLAQTA
jgi:hypothetical protein